jgi:hypothetical protein
VGKMTTKKEIVKFSQMIDKHLKTGGFNSAKEEEFTLRKIQLQIQRRRKNEFKKDIIRN